MPDPLWTAPRGKLSLYISVFTPFFLLGGALGADSSAPNEDISASSSDVARQTTRSKWPAICLAKSIAGVLLMPNHAQYFMKQINK